MKSAILKAYEITDSKILEKAKELGTGGSTAVTAILIDGLKLVVANVGDSRAIICKNGMAKQLSIDHEPIKEREIIEKKVSIMNDTNFYLVNRIMSELVLSMNNSMLIRIKFTCILSTTRDRKYADNSGDVPRVDGQLAVARAFGDSSLKVHLSSEPFVHEETIDDDDTDFLILASDGLWKVMSNQEAVDAIKGIKDPLSAAKHLTEEALIRKSKDDISCIVVKFEY